MNPLQFPQIIRYLIVAATVYAIDMGGYILLLYFGFSPVVSNILVKVAAPTFGFFAHRYYTYQITNNKDFLKQAFKYLCMACLYVPVSTLFLTGMLKIITNPILAKFICDIVLFVVMYLLTSKFAFLQSSTEEKKVDK